MKLVTDEKPEKQPSQVQLDGCVVINEAEAALERAVTRLGDIVNDNTMTPEDRDWAEAALGMLEDALSTVEQIGI
jgi:hypothetical protein